ncbi:hypothetical protein Tco_1056726 [Tanacetum coccineum]|uniref:Uncharacterized protein n=1 Tax=Tanacetum coccineum TaxID=301880 RepID=A0ABQ5H447_9ASTR
MMIKREKIFNNALSWKGRNGYYEIMRADGSAKTYLLFSQLLKEFDREHLENLWKLVKAKHGNTRPEEGYERVLWGDLKTMFEHHIEDEVWRSLQGKKVLLWRLYDSCRVHIVRFEDMYVYMLVEKRYPLTPATITDMLNKKLKSNYWNETWEDCWIKSFIRLFGITAALIKVSVAQEESGLLVYKEPLSIMFKMDDPNITKEEYIKLQAEKAQRRGRTFNWETTTYGKVYCDNLDFFIDFEADFPAIVYNDALISSQNVSSKPTVSIYNAIKTDFDFSISFSDSDDEDYTFICDKDSFSYKLIHADELKLELVNDHIEINTELCSENIDIKPMDSVVCISNDTTPVESDEHLETNHDKKNELSETSNFIQIIKVMSQISFHEGKPLIFIINNLYVTFGIPFDPKQLYKDGVYTRRLRRPRMSDTEMGLDIANIMCFQLGGARRSMSRPNNGGNLGMQNNDQS